MKRLLVGAVLLAAGSAHADDGYWFAKFGTARLGLTDEVVEQARGSSPTQMVGLGYPLGKGFAVEFAWHDLGTYRFTLEKPFHWQSLTVTLPGYAELRAYGPSIGLTYQSPVYVYGTLRAIRVKAEAEVHSPIGYQLYNETGWLPVAEVGLRFGPLIIEHTQAPKLSSWLVGISKSF